MPSMARVSVGTSVCQTMATYTRPPAATTLPWPPSSSDGIGSLSQSLGSPLAGHASDSGPLSDWRPLRDGPRHCGQSLAAAAPPMTVSQAMRNIHAPECRDRSWKVFIS